MMKTEIIKIDEIMATFGRRDSQMLNDAKILGEFVGTLSVMSCADADGQKYKKKPPVPPRRALEGKTDTESNAETVAESSTCIAAPATEKSDDGATHEKKIILETLQPSQADVVDDSLCHAIDSHENNKIQINVETGENSKSDRTIFETHTCEIEDTCANVCQTPSENRKSIFDEGDVNGRPPIPPARKKKPILVRKSKEHLLGSAGGEYENHELIMLKRGEEATKGKRRQSLKRKESIKKMSVQEFDRKDVTMNLEKEEVIIEWKDTIPVVQEPIILESKEIPWRLGSDSTNDDDTEDIALDELEIASDIDEDVALRSYSWSHYRDRPLLSLDLKEWCAEDTIFDLTEESSSSIEDFGGDLGMEEPLLAVVCKGLWRSRSVDYFSEFYSEESLSSTPGSYDSSLNERRDVCAWMGSIRWHPVEEADFEKWYAAHDEEDRIYFYHENSNISRWKLPDLPDTPKGGVGNAIQRSATESVIPKNGVDLRQRHSTDKDISRASKARSMILDAKINLTSETRKLNSEFVELRWSGILHRTKIMENGKKCSKKWMALYAVLCKSSIFFFKDEKTFVQMKETGRVADNSFVSHKLDGAVIDEPTKLSARKNVFRISWPDTRSEILIQHDTQAFVLQWVTAIQDAIDKQPRSRKGSSSSVRNASNESVETQSQSPVKVRRAKSIKGKAKGSTEDLSSSNSSENKSKIGEILKKFILRRPSSDSLRLKGILKDEPVFGCSLETITQNRDPRVPEFVKRCIDIIESTDENMKTDGLYRASGNLSQVQKIRLEVDQNRLGFLEHEDDVHVLTGSLKLFFRELKQPLIPFHAFQTALKACQNPKPKQRIKELKKVLESLPKPNFDTLKVLLEHLVKVQNFKSDNRMDISNLAIVFGPTLTWPVEDSGNMAIDLMYQNRLIEALLKECSSIFSDS